MALRQVLIWLWGVALVYIGLVTQYSQCTEKSEHISSQTMKDLYKRVEMMQSQIGDLNEDNRKMQSHIHDLKENIDDLNEENHKKQSHIDDLNEENHKLQSHIDNLKEDIDDLKEENHRMQSHIDNILVENNNRKCEIDAVNIETHLVNTEAKQLKADITDLQIDNEDIKDILNVNVHNFDLLQTTLRGFKSDLENTRNQQNEFVAFTAYATATRDYDVDERLLFDGVLTNYGEHYNEVLGIFVCPVSGYYLFMVHYRSYSPQMWASIRLDGIDMVTTLAEASGDQGSNSVITQCEPGQIVDVISQNDGQQMGGEPASSGRWSTFSGALLQIIVT